MAIAEGTTGHTIIVVTSGITGILSVTGTSATTGILTITGTNVTISILTTAMASTVVVLVFGDLTINEDITATQDIGTNFEGTSALAGVLETSGLGTALKTTIVAPLATIDTKRGIWLKQSVRGQPV